MNFTTGYILTKAGEALHAQVEAGTTLKLTKMQLGSGTVTTVDDYYERSTLVEPQNAMSIAEIQQVTAEKNMCVATAVLTNAAVDTSYMASELGLFAQNTDGTEILYAVSYDDHPSYIASKNDGTDITMKFSMYIVATSEITITLTLPKTAEEIATVAAGYAAQAAESELKAKQLEATANNYLQTTQQAMTLANGYANISKAWAEGNASPDGVVDTNSPTGYTQSAKIWAALSREYAGLSKFKLPIGYYSNIDEMRKSETAIVNRPCVTLGYYEPNDGGGAVYIIRQKKESDVDDGGSCIFLDNGNVAELLIDGAVNVKQFGAKGDGIHDDTNALCVACDSAININLSKGTYAISDSIKVSHQLKLAGSGTIKKFGERAFAYFALTTAIEAFEMDGITIDGNLEKYNTRLFTRNPDADLNGLHAIYTTNNSNLFSDAYPKEIILRNCTFKHMHGGVYASNTEMIVDNCCFYNIEARAAVNVQYEGRLTVTNSFFENIGLFPENFNVDGSYYKFADNSINKFAMEFGDAINGETNYLYACNNVILNASRCAIVHDLCNTFSLPNNGAVIKNNIIKYDSDKILCCNPLGSLWVEQTKDAVIADNTVIVTEINPDNPDTRIIIATPETPNATISIMDNKILLGDANVELCYAIRANGCKGLLLQIKNNVIRGRVKRAIYIEANTETANNIILANNTTYHTQVVMDTNDNKYAGIFISNNLSCESLQIEGNICKSDGTFISHGYNVSLLMYVNMVDDLTILNNQLVCGLIMSQNKGGTTIRNNMISGNAIVTNVGESQTRIVGNNVGVALTVDTRDSTIIDSNDFKKDVVTTVGSKSIIKSNNFWKSLVLNTCQESTIYNNYFYQYEADTETIGSIYTNGNTNKTTIANNIFEAEGTNKTGIYYDTNATKGDITQNNLFIGITTQVHES